MRPVTDYYPKVERCSWEIPQYYELLKRGIRWGLGENQQAITYQKVQLRQGQTPLSVFR